MIGTAIAVGLLTLAVGLLAVLLLRLLPSLRLQLAGLAALSVCLPLASVLLSGWVAFHMGDDVKILAVSAASATVAVVAGLVLARSIVGSVDRVRDASARLAGGDLTVRAPESGPAEVAELASSFNEMAASLERLFDARRELVAWASHDLRTPLANMQAMLEALEDGLVAPETAVPVLREQVVLLSVLVDDLFELARIDSGVLTLELHAAPLEPVVESCLRGVEADARRRGIGLAASVPELVSARCAPEKVERVLFNLLTNALRHTPSDGSVAVRVEQLDREIQVSVEDTGEGLDDEARARMFDRFWRGDPARSARGSGLGLAIARGLVEAHGGRIWAEDRPGGGARVSFTLPAAS
ncbi:MAG TPA: HAMP domain-containing sensor histidine kinase [Gaiella sp.]|nr:HAMP domain-containing sensor histidine kinase [Gaiella sp.]